MPMPQHFRAALADRPWRGRSSLVLAGLASLALVGALLPQSLRAVSAAPAMPRVVDVPNTPAFIKPPQGGERPTRPGQTLSYESILRTQKPGRMQVQLANGRSFRLGGDAVLRLGRQRLDLQRGQIIAWVNPGTKGGAPLTIHTRVATASIVGTTVFIEASDTSLSDLQLGGRGGLHHNGRSAQDPAQR